MMDLQTKKLNFIQEILSVSNEKIIDKLDSLLKKEQNNFDATLKDKLISRALKSNQDIKEGNLLTREEAEKRLNKRMGL